MAEKTVWRQDLLGELTALLSMSPLEFRDEVNLEETGVMGPS